MPRLTFAAAALAAAALSLPAPVAAGEWWKLVGDDASLVVVDAAGMRTVGPRVIEVRAVEVQLEGKTPSAAHSSIQMRVDCEARRQQILHMAWYDKNGQVKQDLYRQPWTAVQPGEALYQFVCTGKRDAPFRMLKGYEPTEHVSAAAAGRPDWRELATEEESRLVVFGDANSRKPGTGETKTRAANIVIRFETSDGAVEGYTQTDYEADCTVGARRARGDIVHRAAAGQAFEREHFDWSPVPEADVTDAAIADFVCYGFAGKPQPDLELPF